MDIWPNIITSMSGFVETVDWKQYRARGGTRDLLIHAEGKHQVDGGTIDGVLQNGLWFGPVFGNEGVDGTNDGTGNTTLDAAVSAGDTVIPVAATTGFAANEKVAIRDSDSTIQEVRNIASVQAGVSLTVSPAIRFAHASGTTAREVTNPYTHTFTGNDTSIPSYTMEADFLDTTNLSIYVEGMSADSLTIAGGEEGEVTFSSSILAQKTVKNSGALSTVTAATTSPYLFHQATFTYFGSAVARIRDFSWTVDNGGKIPAYHTDDETTFPYEYIPGARFYTLETTVIPTDATFFDQLKSAASNLACNIKYVRTASPEDSLEILNTNCVLKEAPHDMPEELEVPVRLVLEPLTASVVVKDNTQDQFDI